MDEIQVKQLIEEMLKNRVQCQTVTAKEAAVYVGVCQDTLMEEVRKGKVPHTKLRGRYLFRLASLDRWMDEQEQANTELRRQFEAQRLAELVEQTGQIARAEVSKMLQGSSPSRSARASIR
jgi:excisionase family DNA binding protein